MVETPKVDSATNTNPDVRVRRGKDATLFVTKEYHSLAAARPSPPRRGTEGARFGRARPATQ